MPVVGYSGTPLGQKLGLVPASTVLVIDPPAPYESLFERPLNLRYLGATATGVPFIHGFVRSVTPLAPLFKRAKRQLANHGTLWVSWLKGKASLTENDVRAAGLAVGFVDVKVCAVNNQWSGLKFVRRLKDR